MPDWLFYEVTHADHAYLNPISDEGIEALERVLELRSGTRVLDIACGHASMLIGFAERHGIVGVGVDASPYAFARAEARRKERVPEADLTLVHGLGEEYATDEPFDVAMCVGASWIWSGLPGTLRALAGFVRPGGLIVSGEPYWRREPTPEYCAQQEIRAEDFHDLAGCWKVALGLGLAPVWARRSTAAEWDRYELDQLAALDRFARANPDHPELPAIRKRAWLDKEAYLRWGHREIGFALWVFRTPEDA